MTKRDVNIDTSDLLQRQPNAIFKKKEISFFIRCSKLRYILYSI